jgi:hypothetical protein
MESGWNGHYRTLWIPGWISGEGRVEQEADGSWA